MAKEYENGFYVYIPKSARKGYFDGLSVPQVIEIREGDIWLTSIDKNFNIDFVESKGCIGKMLMTQQGELK